MFYDIGRYLTDKYFGIVWGCHAPRDTSKWTPPNGHPQKSIYSAAQLRVPVCFDISRYLTVKYFDIVWGCQASGDYPKRTPQKSIYSTAQLREPVFYDISRDLTANILA